MRCTISLAALVLVGALADSIVVAQQMTTHDHDTAAPAQPARQTMMMGNDHQMTNTDSHQEMGEQQQRMMAAVKEADERIQQLVTRMNAEQGDQKIATMAELLTALAADRANLQRHMMEMAGCPMAQSSTK